MRGTIVLGRIAIIAAVAAVTIPAVAAAQTAPTSRVITLTYTGTVAVDGTNSVKVRQPDGSYAPYTGPLPDIPYMNGDQVTISFNATVPTKAFYDSGTYQGQIAADGIYRIRVTTPSSGSSGQIGYSTAADVSGPIGYSPNYGEPPYSAMTVVYDYNTDSYSIENGGNFLAANMWGAGYAFDAAGNIVACQTLNCAPSQYDFNSFVLQGSADGSTIGARNIGIYDPISGSNRQGLWDLMFSGSWNLPKFGGSTQVPEPGMLVLFGAAAAFPILRRRKRVRLAA